MTKESTTMGEQQPSREKFASRIGFILISAGCAIGLGNVWRFPYVTGEYGGAAFVLLYLLFLVILGLPILVMEFSVGRASQKSCARSFNILEPKGTKWHLYKWFAIAGNYILMMFYTTVAGWMVAYAFKMGTGQLNGVAPENTGSVFAARPRLRERRSTLCSRIPRSSWAGCSALYSSAFSSAAWAFRKAWSASRRL